MRTLPKYSQLRIIHEDADGIQTLLYCDEVTKSKQIDLVFGAPIKGSSSRYITNTDVDIKINDKIHVGEETKRVTAIPEDHLDKFNNNARRGYLGRTDKLFETS